MQEVELQNQQFVLDITQLQEDMQTLLLQMDAAKQDQTAAEVELSQGKQLIAQV